MVVKEKKNRVVAFTTRVRSKTNMYNDGEFSDEDLSHEDYAEAYRLLYLKWKEEFNMEKQRVKINVLLQDKVNLTATIIELKE